MALRSILVSPKFLFRFESQPPEIAPNTRVSPQRHRLGVAAVVLHLEQHSRTKSCWTLAAKETLQQPEVLAAAGEADAGRPEIAGAGRQLRGPVAAHPQRAAHQPSPETLFHFDDNLRQALEQETELFFESIIRENRTVHDLLDADYTFLNERLARHYGIPGVLRRALPAGVACRRTASARGLLGQGSILMVAPRIRTGRRR